MASNNSNSDSLNKQTTHKGTNDINKWECKHCNLLNYPNNTQCIACFNSKQHKGINNETFQYGIFEHKLRNEWTIGSKCMVFSRTFEKWIHTNIEIIENKQNEQILTVKNYG
eukprot:204396_1